MDVEDKHAKAYDHFQMIAASQHWLWFIGLLAFVVVVSVFIITFPTIPTIPKTLPAMPVPTPRVTNLLLQPSRAMPVPASPETFANRTLPADIFAAQIGHRYVYHGVDYLIYRKRNMNFYFPGDSSAQSGVLYATTGDSVWKKYLYIQDTPDASNNPYWLDYRGGTLYLLIVDTNGAGSGEGHAKLISINPITQTWKVETCFYYSTDFDWRPNQTLSLAAAIQNYLRTRPNSVYHLNPSNGEYELIYFDRQSQSTKTVQMGDCSNLQIIL